ncbi:hypothetical protein PF005_g32481 [Phytophthora fragariae]|uniref:Uncharacterized protein n=1 Tax=Phytophthora fragariae TaxID=53985 RepID=A0A6A3D413_9STRA|nr:hypothetical protein PF009_g33512 [Phytophthora fragariae]KAE9056387.1 hypothetical protein PF007_g32012 [Phytophthora fragariae]KAE9156170.1 hypothetical protein PF002_g33677 [Phytophthora fragariae]KAE9158366.1 hypothetical protein PF005_g32481 [Phytophthora fragariae]KAE9158670.1 hypothetical protein PF004_g31802 [Phytophthora fragariae]
MKPVTLRVCSRLILPVSLGRTWKKRLLCVSVTTTWSPSCAMLSPRYLRWSSASGTNVLTWTVCSFS